MRSADPDPPLRRKVIHAAMKLMLLRGFPQTSVDDVCAAGGVTKGAFFHYFKTKEDLGAAVLDAYLERVFDPLARIDACLEFLSDAAENGPVRHGCILGSFAQDLETSHPRLRASCARHF